MQDSLLNTCMYDNFAWNGYIPLSKISMDTCMGMLPRHNRKQTNKQKLHMYYPAI